MDDGVSIITASRPISEILSGMLASGEVHPPLYFYYLHPFAGVAAGSWALGGGVEAWFRWSTMPWSFATVVLTWMLAVRLLSPRAAFIATLLAIASSYLSYFGQEVRMYPMLATFVLAASLFAVRMPEAKWLGPAFAAACILAFFTHYLALFYIAALALFLVGRHREIGPRALAIALVPVIAAVVAWLPIIRQQAAAQPLMLRAAPGWPEVIELFFQMGCGVTWPLPLPGWTELTSRGWPLHPMQWCGLVVIGVAAYGVLRLKERSFIALFLALPIAAVIGLSAFTSIRIFEYKYFQASAPLLCIALAAAGGEWRRPRPATLVVVGLLFANLFAWGMFQARPEWYGPQDWRGLLRAVRPSFEKGDEVVVHPSMMSAPVLVYAVFEDRWLLPGVYGADREDQVRSARRLWVLLTPNHPFVRQQHLLVDLMKNWKPVQQIERRSFWPANDVQAVLLIHDQGPATGTL
ncbi:MAG: glycosyltransferase family 39 protein [Armatimonadetes bacterium]|nr:glycosyltransferase family 39 protein [Armatimonadota bacterium]